LKIRDTQLVGWFRQSAPYVNSHRGKTFVLMVGGEALAHENFPNILNDVALLNSLGIRIVLVYGTRPQIDAKLTEQGIPLEFYQNTRITGDAAFSEIKGVIGQQQLEITAHLSMSLINTPMQGAQINVVSGNFVNAQPFGIVDGVDFLHTGRVRRIDVDGIKRQLDQHAIVVLGPIGFSVTGESFNLAAEEIATQVAIRLGADKLIGFSSEQGVLDDDGNVIPEMFPDEASQRLEKLIGQGEIDTGTTRYLRAAIASCRAGVRRSHLVSYKMDGSLLQELFSRDGIGTQIVKVSAECSRPASIDDIGGILALITPLEEQGILVRRSREQLEMEIERFIIVEREGLVIGCAALYPFEEEAMGELACVAMHPEYRGDTRGAMLIEQVERQAKQRGLKRLFALTTHSIHWFRERGFEPVTLDTLPMKKQALYNFQRRSRILMKTLA